MTKLLVSVRNAEEALLAVEAGADLIDVKEPRHGSLGRADAVVVEQVLQVVGGRRPVSAALGELCEYDAVGHEDLLLPAKLRFVKVGLARLGGNAHWPRRWAALWERLPPVVGRVAVVYADWQTARAPSPDDVLQHAVAMRCCALLIDTFDKAGPALTTLWTPAELLELVGAARERNLMVVFAGRVTEEDLAVLLPIGPDFIAVRGAVCRPDRQGTIDAARIDRLRKLLTCPC